MVSIVDNFLSEEDFKKLQLYMNAAPWIFSDIIDYFGEELDTFMFTHQFFSTPHLMNDCTSISPIINKLSVIAMRHIKANLLTRTPAIIENKFHVDISDLADLPEKLKQWTTSIFYVNTNNGYTKFEDGTKVESVANRIITFPANMKHTGTSCTDEKIRVVINFNYFSR